jgi:hypothetical protein
VGGATGHPFLWANSECAGNFLRVDEIERRKLEARALDRPPCIEPNAPGERTLAVEDPLDGHGRSAGLQPHHVSGHHLKAIAARGHQSSSAAPDAVDCA